MDEKAYADYHSKLDPQFNAVYQFCFGKNIENAKVKQAEGSFDTSEKSKSKSPISNQGRTQIPVNNISPKPPIQNFDFKPTPVPSTSTPTKNIVIAGLGQEIKPAQKDSAEEAVVRKIIIDYLMVDNELT